MLDDEEYEPTAIDLTWYFFIGMTKFSMSEKRVGRLTLTLFNKLYKCYKDNFDMEMMMNKSGITYHQANKKALEKELWLK